MDERFAILKYSSYRYFTLTDNWGRLRAIHTMRILNALLLCAVMAIPIGAMAQDASQLREGFTLIGDEEIPEPAPKIRTERFNGECTTDKGHNVAYLLSTNKMLSVESDGSKKSSFSVNFLFGKARSGQVRGYLNFTSDGEITNEIPESMNDADPVISESALVLSDNLRGKYFQIQRTYKDDWHGVFSFRGYLENVDVLGDVFSTYVFPIKCKGEVTF